MEVKPRGMSFMDRLRTTKARNELSSRYINSAADIKTMLNLASGEALKETGPSVEEFRRLMEARMASIHERTYEDKFGIKGFFDSKSDSKYNAKDDFFSKDFFSIGEVASYSKPKPKADADKPQTEAESAWA